MEPPLPFWLQPRTSVAAEDLVIIPVTQSGPCCSATTLSAQDQFFKQPGTHTKKKECKRLALISFKTFRFAEVDQRVIPNPQVTKQKQVWEP